MTSRELLAKLACPRCRGPLSGIGFRPVAPSGVRCEDCSQTYPLVDGIPVLLAEPPAPEPTEEGPELTVLMLAPGQGADLERVLFEVVRVLGDLGIAYELVVVHEGLPAPLLEACQRLEVHLHRLSSPGYGHALQEGFTLARGEYVMTLDPDLSHDPNFLRNLWAQRERAEVLIGSRYIHRGDAFMPYSRELFSRLLNRTVQRVLCLPVADLSSGLRLYRRRVLRDLQLTASDFDVLIEILTKLYSQGYRTQEIPFVYRPLGTSRTNLPHLVRFTASYVGSLFRLWKLRNSVGSADYDSRAYHSWLPPQRYWQRERYRIILGFLGGQLTDILDVGCGSSKIIQSLPGSVGLDFSLGKLRFLQTTNSLLVNGSIFDLPFRNACFDTVICSEVIEHVPDPEASVAELLRVLRPGGRLILGTPDYGTLRWRIIEWIYERVIPGGYAGEHITHLTRASLHRLLDKLGVDLLAEEYVFKADWFGMGRKR